MTLLLRASISTLLEYPLRKENARTKTNGELPRPLPETSADIGVGGYATTVAAPLCLNISIIETGSTKRRR